MPRIQGKLLIYKGLLTNNLFAIKLYKNNWNYNTKPIRNHFYDKGWIIID
jgi:hypothetical protein